jgi:hypothetical protein
VNGTFGVATNTALTAGDAGAVPFTFSSIGKGAILNSSSSLNSDGSLVGGSADNFRYEIANIDNAQGTFSLIIRRGDDNTKNRVVLESFNDLSLDPNNPGYIERVIGNQTKSVVTDGATKYVSTTGEYVNRSNFIKIDTVGRQTLD